MLAPPPEGSFDIDYGNLPVKGPPKEDGSPEQVPLLTQEEAVQTNSNVSKGNMVRIICLYLVAINTCFFFFPLQERINL